MSSDGMPPRVTVMRVVVFVAGAAIVLSCAAPPRCPAVTTPPRTTEASGGDSRRGRPDAPDPGEPACPVTLSATLMRDDGVDPITKVVVPGSRESLALRNEIECLVVYEEPSVSAECHLVGGSSFEVAAFCSRSNPPSDPRGAGIQMLRIVPPGMSQGFMFSLDCEREQWCEGRPRRR